MLLNITSGTDALRQGARAPAPPRGKLRIPSRFEQPSGFGHRAGSEPAPLSVQEPFFLQGGAFSLFLTHQDYRVLIQGRQEGSCSPSHPSQPNKSKPECFRPTRAAQSNPHCCGRAPVPTLLAGLTVHPCPPKDND